MEMTSIIPIAAIIAIAFGYALWPLVSPSGAAQIDSSSEDGQARRAEEELSRLFQEREQAYKNIMEIELDREMGKLSDEDYEEMIAQSREDALEVLRRLEVRGVKEGMVPAHVSNKDVHEAAVRASGLSAEESRSQKKQEKSLDDRLEEEILQFRKVKSEKV